MAGEAPETLSLGPYLTGSSFAQAVTENRQSEYLQFTLFILLTVWFVQKWSPESKQLGEEGRESEAQQLLGVNARSDSLAVYLRQRGSPESKPVGARHHATSVEG